jgi:hypothetical protein
MKTTSIALTAGTLVLAACNHVYAQYAPPPPLQPFPGFINDYLRKKDPYNSVWDLGGAVRLRYELKDDGLGLPPNADFRDNFAGNDNDYFSDKIIVRAGYTGQWFSVLAEGRSSSTVGDARATQFEEDDPIDLHQAFVTVGNHKEFPVSLKAGRQELSYGDERLVGAFAWNNIGRVFDAVKVRWQNSLFALEAFGSKLVLPVDDEFNEWNDYNVFSGLHITTKEIPKTLTELYFFARNDKVGSTTANPGAFAPFQVAAPPARDIYTVGARFKSNPGELGNFDYTVEGAFQFGSWKRAGTAPVRPGARDDHEAYAFVANVGYTFADTAGTPRVALEYAYGSGDSNPNDGTHETFDNLYPTNHKFYGYMDFLSWQNLHDVRGIFTIKPTPRLSLAVEGHLFWLADTGDSLYNAGGAGRTGGTAGAGNGFAINPAYGSYVGAEVDVVAGFIINKFSSLEAGYGHFFTGDYLDQTWAAPGFGSADADWVYIQTVIRF